MTRETLDEAIDRVAASMTAVPHHRESLARIERALDTRGRRPHEWLLAAAIAVLMVGGVMLVRQTGSSHSTVGDSQDVATAPVALPTAPPLEGTRRGSTSQPAVERVTSTRENRGTRERGNRILQESLTPIPALSSPASLVVAELEFETLTVWPVALDDLVLQELDVPEIGAAEESREQR